MNSVSLLRQAIRQFSEIEFMFACHGGDTDAQVRNVLECWEGRGGGEMKAVKIDRGFIVVECEEYISDQPARLIGESSAIGLYNDAWDNPGSSFLWIGEDHHLNREEVKELIDRMQYWLDNKRLEVK